MTAAPYIRNGALPRPVRRVALGAFYLCRGGVFAEWRDGTKPYAAALVPMFRPDVVWGTFGNTDALAIASDLARRAGCPWVMDVKDPWTIFIPKSLRQILAWRYRGAAALTALSEQHAADVEPYFGRRPQVIYSGVDTASFEPRPGSASGGPFRLLVVGGLYDEDRFAGLFAGVRNWLLSLSQSQRDNVRLTYAGSDAGRFALMADSVAGLVAVEIHDFLPAERFAQLAAAASVLLYVRSRAALYQHKLIELAAMGRLVICFPEESDEGLAIAHRLGGYFASCSSPQQVTEALAAARKDPVFRTPDRAALDFFSWDRQAAILGGVFSAVRGIGRQDFCD